MRTSASFSGVSVPASKLVLRLVAPIAWPLRNELLAQRANDLRDVGLRVLSILTGEELRQPEYKPNTILIAKI